MIVADPYRGKKNMFQAKYKKNKSRQEDIFLPTINSEANGVLLQKLCEPENPPAEKGRTLFAMDTAPPGVFKNAILSTQFEQKAEQDNATEDSKRYLTNDLIQLAPQNSKYLYNIMSDS